MATPSSRGHRCRWLAIALPAFLVPGVAASQVIAPGRTVWEGRVDAVAGSVSATEFAIGVQLATGTYFRLVVLGGAGYAWQHGETGGSARIETHGRFHLDPYRESPLGAYGIGGIAARWDEFAEWEPRLVVGAGVELPAHGRAGWALEVAFAGGLRISAVLRGIAPNRR